MMQVYLLSGENFYRQIQARSGSHWALDLPVATGEKSQPLLGTLGLLCSLWWDFEKLLMSESAWGHGRFCCFRPWALVFVVAAAALVFFVVWPVLPDWHISRVTWNFTYLNDELNRKQRFATISQLLMKSEKTKWVSAWAPHGWPPPFINPWRCWETGPELLSDQRVNHNFSLLEKGSYRP